MKRSRPPFSIYPKPEDLAKATEIAGKLDLHVSQVFLKAFRYYVKARKRRAGKARRRRRLAMSR